MPERRGADSDPLKLLMDAGLIDKKATLEDLVELSAKLEGGSGGDNTPSAWQFIVKGKFIWKDDGEPTTDPAE